MSVDKLLVIFIDPGMVFRITTGKYAGDYLKLKGAAKNVLNLNTMLPGYIPDNEAGEPFGSMFFSAQHEGWLACRNPFGDK